MKLIYLTAKRYPGKTADHIYIYEMAKAFYVLLGKDFIFSVSEVEVGHLKNIPHISAGLKWSHLKTIRYFYWLPRFIFSGKYFGQDTVFFSNDPNLLSLLIFWRKFLRLNYIIYSDWHMLFNDFRDRFVMLGSDYLATTSRKLKNKIIKESGINENKIIVAYGGIDLDRYSGVVKEQARDKLNLPIDKKIIAYAGFFKTIGLEKGIRTMIESLKNLPADIIMLFIGGKDSEISEYRELARILGVSDRCVFEGIKNQDEIFLYESAADILSIPYPDKPHFRGYGFPMKVYEYMAANRPIICSKLDLAEEIIGDCAYFFKPDDPVDLANSIMGVLANYGMAQKMAADALAKVSQYTWNKKSERIINFLKQDGIK